MDKQTVQETGTETLVVDALNAVVGGDPRAARTVLAGGSFRDLALITAWADELLRLGRQAQTDYENRERREWREAGRPVTHGEQKALDKALTEHLRSRMASYPPGDGWTDLRDLVLLAAPLTDAGTEEVRVWADSRLQALVQEGVLSPSGNHPGEYRIVSIPGQTNAEADAKEARDWVEGRLRMTNSETVTTA